jgi:holin-like protein
MLAFFILLLVCQLTGEILVVATGVPLPGPVIGMALLFAGLLIRGELPRSLERMADGLLSHLSLLFVPAGVGVMLHARLIGAELIPIAVSVFASTLITIAVTGRLMQGLDRSKGGQ